MLITPLILGKGRSGLALADSFACIALRDPGLEIGQAKWLARDADLATERKKYERAILCISNPHALHTDAILKSEAAGFDAIICEKPVAVNLEQVKRLTQIKTPVAVLHVYRQTWGIQTLRKMIIEHELGNLIAVEGKYWSSSSAEKALKGQPSKTWKDDPALAGNFDTYLDIGTHWVDAASFLLGAYPKEILAWRSHQNGASTLRDTHIQLNLKYPSSARGFASVSKTAHGATNQFEITAIGEKKSVTWQSVSPDELFVGEGSERKVLTKKTNEYGSGLPPFHGTGWTEGYMEIASNLVKKVFHLTDTTYPTLSENLALLEAMLNARFES